MASPPNTTSGAETKAGAAPAPVQAIDSQPPFLRLPVLPMPDLRQIAAETWRSLALLDAVRLEELAIFCQRLDRNLASTNPANHADISQQAQEASSEMAVLARVLEATRANLSVMHRLRDLREGRLEYDCPQQGILETIHGND